MAAYSEHAKRPEGITVQNIDSQKGKGMVATKTFKSGEVIFKEAPLVSAQFLWNAFYRYSACEYCMKSLETAEEMARRLTANDSLVLPHAECCTVRKDEHVACPQCQELYCSAECREKALLQYHRALCPGHSPPDPQHPLQQLYEAWRNIHFPPETASISLVAKMIAMVKQSESKETAISQFSQFCRSTVNEEKEIVHKLLGEKFKDQIDMIQQLLCVALYEDSVSQWFTPDGLRTLLALIGTNAQGTGTSSISVYVKNLDQLETSPEERTSLDEFVDQLYADLEKESAGFLNCEGSALYSLQSL